MPRYYAVSLSDNPGPAVKEHGIEKGVIVAEVGRLDEPDPILFSMACTDFELGCPRIGDVLPYLTDFDPTRWRSVVIGKQTFWTNCEKNSFA